MSDLADLSYIATIIMVPLAVIGLVLGYGRIRERLGGGITTTLTQEEQGRVTTTIIVAREVHIGSQTVGGDVLETTDEISIEPEELDHEESLSSTSQ